MRKKIFVLSVFILIFAVTIVPTFSQQEGSSKNDVVVPSGSGYIDYSNEYISTKGEMQINAAQNKALAIRGAEANAKRRLLETLKGVTIDSKTTAKDLIEANDTLTAELNGFLESGSERVGEPEYGYIKDPVTGQKVVDRNVVVVTVRIPSKKFFSKLLSEILPPSRSVPPILETPSAPPPVSSQTPSAQQQESFIYSGVVIDARNFPVRPALAPKIIDEDGREVYGSTYVDRDWAIREGMAGYAKDINDAKLNPRVSSDSMTVKGIRALNKTDIVISNDDARKIRNAASYQKFLDECRVMIVLQKIVL